MTIAMSAEIDQLAPTFELAATGERTIALEALRGRNVVLYFYPKDNTPGCTQEGQDFRDLYAEFQKLDTEILGISRDSARSHENFSNKYQFPFPLLSDSDETVCHQFGVIKEKKMYGKTRMGVERSTFLIDKEGVLRRAWRGVKVKGHAQAVLDAVHEL